MAGWSSASVCLNNIIQNTITYRTPPTFVTLINDGPDIPDDVIIELDEVDGSKLDVSVVQIFSILMQNYQLLLREVDHHHSLVEVLHC